jgi:hypothetical protein
MAVAVNPPRTPVTKGSNGIAAATVPNVCKMPGPPAPFVPTPLPNIGKSDNSPDGYTTTVTIDGQCVAIRGASFKSMGDIASQGTGGGIASNNTQGATKFVAPGALTVQFDGKNVQLLGDQMLNNCGPSGSPPNSATLAGEVQAPGVLLPLGTITELLCVIFCECLVEARAKKFETPMADLTAVEAPGFDGSDPPGQSQYQACVERKYNKDYKGRVGNVKAEQSFDMRKTPPEPLPDSARGAPGTRRPDFVVTGPSGGVTNVIEMKFPGDRWRKGQKRAYRRIAGGNAPTELNRRRCNC